MFELKTGVTAAECPDRCCCVVNIGVRLKPGGGVSVVDPDGGRFDTYGFDAVQLKG